MKELKFRVWLHDRGYMETAHFDDGKWVSTDGIFSLEVGENDFIEQYTGLKDRHGKEIYEGDIVLDDECGDIGEVEYHAPNFTFHPIYPIERWNSHYIGKYIKVIGNIHENPELLGEEK